MKYKSAIPTHKENKVAVHVKFYIFCVCFSVAYASSIPILSV